MELMIKVRLLLCPSTLFYYDLGPEEHEMEIDAHADMLEIDEQLPDEDDQHALAALQQHGVNDQGETLAVPVNII